MTKSERAAQSLEDRHHWQAEEVRRREEERQSTVQAILRARASGLSMRRIAESFGYDESTVYRWIRRYQSGASLVKPRGRPPKSQRGKW